jgi:hypothetical protein
MHHLILMDLPEAWSSIRLIYRWSLHTFELMYIKLKFHKYLVLTSPTRSLNLVHRHYNYFVGSTDLLLPDKKLFQNQVLRFKSDYRRLCFAIIDTHVMSIFVIEPTLNVLTILIGFSLHSRLHRSQDHITVPCQFDLLHKLYSFFNLYSPYDI